MARLSLYQAHKQKWDNCQACALAGCRSKMVFAKGQFPCDILYVGEAPGYSENVSGVPFDGPAGQILDRILARAFDGFPPFRQAFTNLVCCIPLEADGGKAAEPSPEEIAACAPRLVEFVNIVTPRLIVAVGQLAAYHLDSRYMGNAWAVAAGYASKSRGKVAVAMKQVLSPFAETPRVEITHPAAIGRMNVAVRGLTVQKCVVTLRTAVEDYLLPRS